MRVLALIATALLMGACAPRTAITAWPWSDWYRQGGGGEMGSFKHQRQACLEQVGVSDPSAVTADSSAETDYIVCMNGSGWCTTAFGCQKPGGLVKARAWLFVAVLAATVGCDHATKQIAQASLDSLGVVSLAADTVRLELAANPGGFLSLGAQLPEQLRRGLFVVMVPCALLAISLLLLRGDGAGAHRPLAAALIVGGGLANWIDRLLHDGAVTDFVSLGVNGLRTGIFNVADVAIVAGVALALLNPREPRRELGAGF